jgi:catechol 2,3-dioxygenase
MALFSTKSPEVTQTDMNSTQYRLPASAHVGRVRLAVSSLQRSVEFYTRVIGLAVLESSGSLARLGVKADGRVLLELEERAGVRPIQERSRLGLYHTAFLLPTRTDLSSFVRHLVKLGVGFGAGDHSVSEALYLVDPDGLEVEVYADRPREQWPYVGKQLRMGTDAVRFHTLPPVAEDSWQCAPTGTTVGHVHFYVGDLQAAEAFYCTGLGMDAVVRIPSALFVSAGGYHHHVGLNTWAAGSPVAAEQDARLLFWELVLPHADEIERAAASLGKVDFAINSKSAESNEFTDASGITLRLIQG